MYGCETWTIKKPECQRIGAFEVCCWKRLLRVPWTARRSNQSILKKISPEYSLEGQMLMLKFQKFGHLIQKTNSLEKTLILGNIEGGRRGWRGWAGWMASLTQWTWFSVSSRRCDGPGSLVCCSPWGHKKLDTTQLSAWTELNCEGLYESTAPWESLWPDPGCCERLYRVTCQPLQPQHVPFHSDHEDRVTHIGRWTH